MAYYSHLTASSQVKVGLGKLKGLFVSSAHVSNHRGV